MVNARDLVLSFLAVMRSFTVAAFTLFAASALGAPVNSTVEVADVERATYSTMTAAQISAFKPYTNVSPIF